MNGQEVIVSIIVGACVFYLARRWYRMLAGKPGAGCGCGHCPAHEARREDHGL